MRVCTDCHCSLQTVTVASTSAAKDKDGGSGASSGGRDGGGVDNADGGGGDGDGDNGKRSLPRRIGDGGGGNIGGGDGAGAVEAVPEEGLDLGGSGAVLGFVENLEAVYLTQEIAGDVVLADVLEWGRIQVGLVSPEPAL